MGTETQRMAGTEESPGRICRTIHQYSKGIIPEEDMRKLRAVAKDCMRVKNYVYQRYGGIKSLSKIYFNYTVEKEMNESGLREELGLPSVYFAPAMFDALSDIRTQWTKVKKDIYAAIHANERFAPEDKHYLRFVLKVNGCLEGILNGKAMQLPESLRRRYEEVAADAERSCGVESLNRYLCRQVRKKQRKLHTESAAGFAVKKQGYRYGFNGTEHGIYLTTKEKKKRLFIPLTDSDTYDRTLYIKLKTETGRIEIDVPLFYPAKGHSGYTNEIGLSPGAWHMFTTDSGHIYGERFGQLQRELADYTTASGRTYAREKQNNPGRKKYHARREKLMAGMEAYVNAELNRMLAGEKPRVIYIPKQPHNAGGKQGGYFLKTWKKGLADERLRFKCAEHSVEVIEVLGKGIGTECSECGRQGKHKGNRFICPGCGYEADRKVNAAKNAVKRGKNGQRVNAEYPVEADHDGAEHDGTGHGGAE